MRLRAKFHKAHTSQRPSFCNPTQAHGHRTCSTQARIKAQIQSVTSHIQYCRNISMTSNYQQNESPSLQSSGGHSFTLFVILSELRHAPTDFPDLVGCCHGQNCQSWSCQEATGQPANPAICQTPHEAEGNDRWRLLQSIHQNGYDEIHH